ncbi:M23 family metallopeptidase [Thermohalobacter berrensis]|uniref:M23ase beta-sheet core domain-containing protein n=1 Tax=Thermohalobacter berrensis TaxID=99594 RepID=A0A419T6M2_9FIRM|nr:M23 family metallopeptidase [Thermohalobacter berrensis]RKD33210.1 hypothetical protein BET03_09875 [Thermohalobacter berrensis]
MALNRLGRKITKRIKFKNTYSYKRRNKAFYKKQLKKILISIIIVLIIIFMKMIDTELSKKAIKIVDKTVNSTTNIRESGQRVFQYVQKVFNKPSKVISVFENQNNEETKEVSTPKYISPVTGIVYQKFGNIEKTNNYKVFHKGIDILANKSEVVSIDDGLVIDTGKDDILGNYMKISYGEIEAVYGHLNEIYVKKGQKVMKGQLIATLNNSASKNILHFEIWEKGKPVDPLEKIDISISTVKSYR